MNDKMNAHFVAEQEEILLFNYLKALFNSIKSASLVDIERETPLDSAKISYLVERTRIFERKITQLKKLNPAVRSRLNKCIYDFRRALPTIPCRVIFHFFREHVVVPLENEMLKSHKSADGKAWLRACFMIFKT